MMPFSVVFYNVHANVAGLYNSYYMFVAPSKQTFFTSQQKYVTCQINKDTNVSSVYMYIYLYIIINPLNETEHA